MWGSDAPEQAMIWLLRNNIWWCREQNWYWQLSEHDMYCNIRVFIMIIPSVHFVCLHGYHFRMLCCPYRLPVVRTIVAMNTQGAARTQHGDWMASTTLPDNWLSDMHACLQYQWHHPAVLWFYSIKSPAIQTRTDASVLGHGDSARLAIPQPYVVTPSWKEWPSRRFCNATVFV